MERINPLLERILVISAARQNAVFQCGCDSTDRGSARQEKFKKDMIEHYKPEVEVEQRRDGPWYRKVQCLVTGELLDYERIIAGTSFPTQRG